MSEITTFRRSDGRMDLLVNPRDSSESNALVIAEGGLGGFLFARSRPSDRRSDTLRVKLEGERPREPTARKVASSRGRSRSKVGRTTAKFHKRL